DPADDDQGLDLPDVRDAVRRPAPSVDARGPALHLCRVRAADLPGARLRHAPLCAAAAGHDAAAAILRAAGDVVDRARLLGVDPGGADLQGSRRALDRCGDPVALQAQMNL